MHSGENTTTHKTRTNSNSIQKTEPKKSKREQHKRNNTTESVTTTQQDPTQNNRIHPETIATQRTTQQ